MAEFCRDCSIEMWGEDTGDFAGIAPEGKMVNVLCEGCGGYILVDHEGKRVPDTEVITPEDLRRMREEDIGHP